MNDIQLKKDLDNVNVVIETPNDDSNSSLQRLEMDNWGRILNNKTFKTIKENFRLIKQSIFNLIEDLITDLRGLNTKIKNIENDVSELKINKNTNNTGNVNNNTPNINIQSLVKKDENNIFTGTNAFQNTINITNINNSDGTNLVNMQGETVTLGDISKNINIVGKNKDFLFNGKKIKGGESSSLIPNELKGSKIEIGMHPKGAYTTPRGGNNGSNDNISFSLNAGTNGSNSGILKGKDIYNVNTTLVNREDMVELFNNGTKVINNSVLPLNMNKGVLRFPYRNNDYLPNGSQIARNCGIYYLTFKEIQDVFLQTLDVYSQVERTYTNGKVIITSPSLLKTINTLYKITFDFNFIIRNNSNKLLNKTFKNVEVKIPPLKKGFSLDPLKKTYGFSVLNTIYSDDDYLIKLNFLDTDYYNKNYNLYSSYIMIKDNRNLLENSLNNLREKDISFDFEISNIRLYYKDRSTDTWDMGFTTFKGKSKIDIDDYYEYLQYLNSLPDVISSGIYYNE